MRLIRRDWPVFLVLAPALFTLASTAAGGPVDRLAFIIWLAATAGVTVVVWYQRLTIARQRETIDSQEQRLELYRDRAAGRWLP